MPAVLQIGLDWIKYHTPPYDGGLRDQPIRLMRNIRNAVNAYNSINSWKNAQNLTPEAEQKFLSANQKLVKFMEYVWSLQDDSDNGE
jgi:hypothetical protein